MNDDDRREQLVRKAQYESIREREEKAQQQAKRTVPAGNAPDIAAAVEAARRASEAPPPHPAFATLARVVEIARKIGERQLAPDLDPELRSLLVALTSAAEEATLTPPLRVAVRRSSSPPPMPAVGKKLDDGKARFDLVQDEALAEYVSVLTFGAIKYDADNWRLVPEARARYYAAAQRHLYEWRAARRTHRVPLDPESGLHVLAHALCSVAFVLQLDLEEHGLTHEGEATKRLRNALERARAMRAERERRG